MGNVYSVAGLYNLTTGVKYFVCTVRRKCTESVCVIRVRVAVCPRASYINIQSREKHFLVPHASLETPALHAAQPDIIFLENNT